MLSSASICTGLHTMDPSIKGMFQPGNTNDAATNPCLLVGLTVHHEYKTGEEIIDSFDLVQRTNISDICPGQVNRIMKRWQERVDQGSKKVSTLVFSAYMNYSRKNVGNPSQGYRRTRRRCCRRMAQNVQQLPRLVQPIESV